MGIVNGIFALAMIVLFSIVVAHAVVWAVGGIVMLLRYVVVPLVVLPIRLVGVIGYTAGWTVALPFRLAGVGPPLHGPRLATAGGGVELGVPCDNGLCGCANPASARFCRRCGGTLASPMA